MQINTSYTHENSVVTNAGVRNARNADVFAEHLSNAVKSARDTFTATYNTPMSQFAREYGAWKETRQDKLAVPSKNGVTEENIAYLNERYSGSLSTFEKMEALEAMRDMGIVSQYQYMDALGTAQYLHVVDVKTCPIITDVSSLDNTGNRSLSAGWSKGAFHAPTDWNPEDMPIQKVDSLDDLFEMLGVDKSGSK